MNREFLLIIITLSFLHSSIAQKREFNVNASTGLFSFYGKGSTGTSQIKNTPYTSPQTFTSNPYGKKSGFSYSIELQGKQISKNRMIYGVGLAFENLQTKTSIDTITQDGVIYNIYQATGETKLTNSYLSLTPFIGKRFVFDNVELDLSAGVSISACLKSREFGSAISIDKTFQLEAKNDRKKPAIDVRPEVGLKLQKNRFGLLTGYSIGLVNYYDKSQLMCGGDGSNKKAFSSFWRFGLSYRLNN